jgi:hypothetical protein
MMRKMTGLLQDEHIFCFVLWGEALTMMIVCPQEEARGERLRNEHAFVCVCVRRTPNKANNPTNLVMCT